MSECQKRGVDIVGGLNSRMRIVIQRMTGRKENPSREVDFILSTGGTIDWVGKGVHKAICIVPRHLYSVSFCTLPDPY